MNPLITKINNINGSTYQDKLNFLNMCNCCERHQIDKPFVFTYWNETPLKFTQHNNCYCNCRHMARWICRLYEPPPVTITLSPPSSP